LGKSPSFGIVMPAPYDLDWADLAPDQKRAARSLGYTKKLWDGDVDIAIDEQSWSDLTRAQRRSLKILGYSKQIWDKSEEDSDSDDHEDATDFETAQLVDYFSKRTEYMSASEIDPDVCLFGERIVANDVVQGGKSAHCWFLSTCASLAEKYPDYIRSLIQEKGGGTFVVSLYSYQSREWVEFEVDDRLAVKGGKLVLCQLGAQKAIWPHVLQKAGGRYVGGYSNMDNADPIYAFGMLTGCGPHDICAMDAVEESEPEGPWNIYKIKPIRSNRPHDYDWEAGWFEQEVDRQFPFSKMVSVLEELQTRGWPMTASSDTHAISLLKVEEGRVELRNQADSGRDGTEGSWWADASEVASEFKFINFATWTPPS